jgi:hypothetical protein
MLQQSGDHMESAPNAMKSAENPQIGTTTWTMRPTISSTPGDTVSAGSTTTSKTEGAGKAHGAYSETDNGLTNALQKLADGISGAK